MLQTLALAAALSLAPAQDGSLSLTHARSTIGGPFGPTRTSNTLAPGDIYYLSFDIENLKRDAFGTVRHTVRMEVTDANGKSVYAPKPTEVDENLPLGGTKLPARGYFGIAPNQAKGTYTCRITVTDRAANVTKTLDTTFEVGAPKFALVKFLATVDPGGGIPTAFRGTEGQPLYLTFYIVGFTRDSTTKQPNVTAEFRVFDKSGKPTTEKPLVGIFNKGVGQDEDGILNVVPIPMNQAGDYTLEIKAEDKISGQSDTAKFAIKVLPVEK